MSEDQLQQADSFDDQSAGSTRPPGTPGTAAIVFINILVYLSMGAVGGLEALFSPSQHLAIAFGADLGPLTLNGEYWRILTNCFVHFGLIHIGMNMYVLWDVGRAVENLYGTSKFFFIYLAAGLGGSLISLYFHPQVLSAGASGAVFGAFGAFLAYFKMHGKSFDRNWVESATKSVMVLLVVNLVLGFSPGSRIDNAAHIGGFLFGAIAGFAVIPGRVLARSWNLREIIGAIGVIALISALGYWDQVSFDSNPGLKSPNR